MALRFIHSQLFVTPPAPVDDYTGKNVIVTGSNTGLGFEAARHFTARGASKVIVAVRSLSKGETAKNSIEESTGRKNVVQVMQLDMSSHQSVLDFAKKVSQELDRIDIAVLNAGVARNIWEVFEGDESTIAVNVVSTFLLAYALIPKLVDTSKKFNTRPTLTIVASEVHAMAKFDELKAPQGGIFNRLNEERVNGKETDLDERYNVSKLLEVLFVRALTDKTSLPITINCVNPGLCHSEFAREAGWGLWLLKLFLARTTEVGSRTLVHAGSCGQESNGQYLSDCKVSPPSQFVRSPEGAKAQERVWEELVEKLEKIQGGITKV